MGPWNRWLTVALALVGIACGSSGEERAFLFSGEANRLNAYDPETGAKQTVIERRSLDPDGWDINAQICFNPDAPRQFIAGEDTGQPELAPGWGYFDLAGDDIGEFSATRIGKLTPTYQTGDDNAENYGCGFLSDGRLVTTDVGSQASGPASGQLIIWFPPFDRTDVAFCKLDVAIGTAGGILVLENDDLLVASAREGPGIYRYSGPYPSSNDASGGCGRTDSTGAPLADSVVKSLFIPASAEIPTPNNVTGGPGGFYVASVINGVVAEFDRAGTFVRRIVEPPAGETLGATPFTTGTPFAVAVTPDGTLFYADIGIVIDSTRIGPGAGTGTVRRVRFEDGAPLSPETVDSGLAFPDGLGILLLD